MNELPKPLQDAKDEAEAKQKGLERQRDATLALSSVYAVDGLSADDIDAKALGEIADAFKSARQRAALRQRMDSTTPPPRRMWSSISHR